MSLYVASLALSHFRSHKLTRLELDARPVAIHGRNGSGKTNLLEAVSMLSPGRGMRRATSHDLVRKPEALGWKIKADINTSEQIREIETWSEVGGSRNLKIDGKTTNQIALGKIAPMLWLVPSMDRLWIEGADGRRRFLDRMVLTFEPKHAENALAYEKAMRERNRLLKDMVRDPSWYLALEGQMARAGIAMHQARQRTLGHIIAAQSETATTFPVAELELTQTEGEMPETEEDLSSALAESRFRDLAAGRTLVGPHRADLHAVYVTKGVPARECSTGEQKALLISLVLSNARALSGHRSTPLLLLDEVAAHLDIDRRAALYDELCALKTQAWMTGTEPHLFQALGDRSQYLHLSDDDGISEVRPG